MNRSANLRFVQILHFNIMQTLLGILMVIIGIILAIIVFSVGITAVIYILIFGSVGALIILLPDWLLYHFDVYSGKVFWYILLGAWILSGLGLWTKQKGGLGVLSDLISSVETFFDVLSAPSSSYSSSSSSRQENRQEEEKNYDVKIGHLELTKRYEGYDEYYEDQDGKKYDHTITGYHERN